MLAVQRQTQRQRARTFPRRTHEDGADRLPAAPAQGPVPRRADHRPRCGFAKNRPRISPRTQRQAARPRSCSPAITWPTSRNCANASSSSITAKFSSTASSARSWIASPISSSSPSRLISRHNTFTRASGQIRRSGRTKPGSLNLKVKRDRVIPVCKALLDELPVTRHRYPGSAHRRSHPQDFCPMID